MRLSENEIASINSLVKVHFGNDALAFLFGSRLDDTKKGGDIDLLIKSENTKLMTIRKKASFLTDLKLSIGFQRIDVVFENENLKAKGVFYKSVRSTAKLLQ